MFEGKPTGHCSCYNDNLNYLYYWYFTRGRPGHVGVKSPKFDLKHVWIKTHLLGSVIGIIMVFPDTPMKQKNCSNYLNVALNFSKYFHIC